MNIFKQWFCKNHNWQKCTLNYTNSNNNVTGSDTGYFCKECGKILLPAYPSTSFKNFIIQCRDDYFFNNEKNKLGIDYLLTVIEKCSRYINENQYQIVTDDYKKLCNEIKEILKIKKDNK